jgi:glutaredoxin
LNTQVLGISVDSVPTLVAWADSLGGISYPLISDFNPHGEVTRQFNVFREEGYSERAIFIFDKEGTLQYKKIYDIDFPPDIFELYDEIRRIDPEASDAFPREEKVEELPSGGIVMYCTAWCPHCRKAREWLEERELEYTEVDVYRVPGAEAQVRTWADGNIVSPTFDIDGEIVVDFDKERLSQLLERK